jgi:CrcB protein
MNTILAVGFGGGIGALMRHFMNGAVANWLGPEFPWGIMFINILGSLIMGVLVGFFGLVAEIPQHWKIFLTTGILGGFTTFSTFSLDSVMLIERGQYAQAALYIGGSVIVSLLALALGMWGMRLWPV